MVARYPDQAAAHLCLGEAFPQRAKNAWQIEIAAPSSGIGGWPSTKREALLLDPKTLGPASSWPSFSVGSMISLLRRERQRQTVALFGRR